MHVTLCVFLRGRPHPHSLGRVKSLQNTCPAVATPIGLYAALLLCNKIVERTRHTCMPIITVLTSFALIQKKKKRALFRFGLVPPMGATATARFIVAFSVTGIPLPVDRGSNRARPETAIQIYAPYMCRPYLVGLHFDALANGLGAQQCHPRVQYCLYHRLAAPK